MHSKGWALETAVLFLLLLLFVNSAAAVDSSFSLIQRGEYLTKAGDCAACHTSSKDKPFAGGVGIPTPFGTIYSTNITPDKETGIGNWSEQDFYRALHDGITPDGEHLYPAMPYPWYTKMTRDDVSAVKAYLGTLKPVRQAGKRNQLPWPMSWRGAMTAWNDLYFQPGEFKPQAGKSVQWNRGAYLVEGLGHCGACHTPKNMLGADKNGKNLAGASSGEGWYAPNLAGDFRDGIGGWSVRDIVEYLKTGSTAKTAAAGQMAQVVKDSTQYLSDSDLNAIATYLMSMPIRKKQAETASVDARRMMRGEALYIDNCAGCHMQHGEGLAKVFPSLKGDSAVQAQRPDTLIHLVLAGGKRPATTARPTAFAMPAFGAKLDDSEVADLITYVRNAWGNRASEVDAKTVSTLRRHLASAD